MGVITIAFPTEAEEDLLRRFTVNRNYLAAMSAFLQETYGEGSSTYVGLKAAAEAHRPFHTIQRRDADLEEVRRFLILGWASEIQLHLPSRMGTDAVIGFANAWAPVHAYYSAFGLLQAWFASNGLAGTANDHTATLRTIANMINQRDLLPQPWNLLAVGCPMRGDRLHIHAGGLDCTSHVEVLSSPPVTGADPTFWPRYGTWLRSTREARLKAREGEWKKRNNAKRISPTERTRIAESLAPTSFFDCLWRMRIKSNYGTIDPYLVSQISASDHRVFNHALSAITRATLGLLELYIARRIGSDAYRQIAGEFIKQDSAGLAETTLQARCKAFGLEAG